MASMGACPPRIFTQKVGSSDSSAIPKGGRGCWKPWRGAGWEVTPLRLFPAQVSADTPLPEPLFLCGTSTRPAPATSVPWVFVPRGPLFLYTRVKLQSRTPRKLTRETVN